MLCSRVAVLVGAVSRRPRLLLGCELRELRRRLYSTAVAKFDHTVSRLREPCRVGDRHDSAAVLVAQPGERVDHDLLIGRVELPRRFVRQHERRSTGGCCGDRDPLLFTSGKLRGVVPAAAIKAELREGRPRVFATSTGVSEIERGNDVLQRGERRPQVVALEHDCDLCAPVASKPAVIEPPQGETEGANLAGRGLIHARGQLKKRALARSGRPEQGHDLPALDPNVETAQRDRLDRSGPEELEDIVELERGPLELLRCADRFPVKAFYRQRKLRLIIRNASTLSTPLGAPRSMTERLPPLDK